MMPERGERLSSNEFVVPVLEYQSESTRIKGFQELFEFGLRAPEPMFVLGDKAFRYWLREGMDDRLRFDIGTVFGEIKNNNVTRGAYVGRAFFVPGVNNPNGPRTAAIWDKETYINEVEKFWRFVTAPERNYNVEGSDIAMILHPFLHVMDKRPNYGEKLLADEVLPWSGGYIVPAPVPDRPGQVKIRATFGPDEAVQSCPSDEYLVDPERGTIFSKTILLKNYTYVPTEGNRYEEVELPYLWQEEQALTDLEVIEVAKEAGKVFSRRPNSRVEFIMQAEGPYIREIAPYENPDEKNLFMFTEGEEMTGKVIRIESLKDVAKVKGKEAIVYFAPEAYRERTTDLFALVAYAPVKRIIALAYGTIETSHMMRILNEAGRSIILMGDRELVEGEEVKISRDADGLPVMEYLNPYHETVVLFREVSKLVVDAAGKKVARLARMRQAGLPIPDGFGVTSEAVRNYLIETGIHEEVLQLDTINLNHKKRLEKITDEIREKILNSPLPKEMEERINKGISKFNFNQWAIRSSGSEDGEKQSLAGLYQSVVAVQPERVTLEMRKTIASYFSPASISILRKMGQVPSRMTIGVGVHEYIPTFPGTLGAVVFTDRDKILIEATEGSPGEVVDGTAKEYIKTTIDRNSWEIIQERIGGTKLIFPNQVVEEVKEVVLKIEQLFQSFQDIELLVTPQGGIMIVQARPR